MSPSAHPVDASIYSLSPEMPLNSGTPSTSHEGPDHAKSAPAATTSQTDDQQRESLSQRPISIDYAVPIRALVSPQPPGVAVQESEYHMEDPSMSRRYTRMFGWGSSTVMRGLPPQAWCFVLGFVFPVFWWVGSFLPLRRVIVSRLRENGLWEEWNDVDPIGVLPFSLLASLCLTRLLTAQQLCGDFAVD